MSLITHGHLLPYCAEVASESALRIATSHRFSGGMKAAAILEFHTYSRKARRVRSDPAVEEIAASKVDILAAEIAARTLLSSLAVIASIGSDIYAV